MRLIETKIIYACGIVKSGKSPIKMKTIQGLNDSLGFLGSSNKKNLPPVWFHFQSNFHISNIFKVENFFTRFLCKSNNMFGLVIFSCRLPKFDNKNI